MPFGRLALAMVLWEVRCRVGEDLADVLDGPETELLMVIVSDAIDHQNTSGQRFTGDPA